VSGRGSVIARAAEVALVQLLDGIAQQRAFRWLDVSDVAAYSVS
jgi:hypothetical protein